MLLGVIADDFTGASDVANCLAKEGMQTRLFVGANGAIGGCEAGVIALKTRSVPAEAAVRQSLAALAKLQAAGCRQFHFKYCSTFDSTPKGNIGPVAAALAEALDATRVVVCPAFPATGRTVYQGHLFVGDRLLSESGMERHPLTPMTDPDLRRWLCRQTDAAVGHVPLAAVRDGAAAVRQALDDQAATLVVVDAVSDMDLRAIGAACAGDRLLTGGSGIALGLPDNFRQMGAIAGLSSSFQPCHGPALVLSGSCSTATRGQVAAYAQNHPSFEIDVDALMSGVPLREAAQPFAAQHRDAAPLLYSSADPDRVRAAQDRWGTTRSAEAIESLFSGLAVWAAEAGFERIVSAGGETSGAVVTGLGVDALDLGPEIAPGVPALSTTDGRLALALKSGNFGDEAFFEKAVRMLGGADE